MPQDNVEEIMHAMRIGQEAGPDLYAAFGFAPYDNTMLWGNALFIFLSVWPLLNMCMFIGMQGTLPTSTQQGVHVSQVFHPKNILTAIPFENGLCLILLYPQ